MTREPRHRNRLAIGRPRTSTLVLIGLFLGFLTLYVWVRPIPESNTGNVQPVTPTRSQTPAAPGLHPDPQPSHTVADAHSLDGTQRDPHTEPHADAGHLDGRRHGHADADDDVLLDQCHVAGVAARLIARPVIADPASDRRLRSRRAASHPGNNHPLWRTIAGGCASYPVEETDTEAVLR